MPNRKAFISDTKVIVSNGMIECWKSDEPCYAIGLDKKPRGSSFLVLVSDEERAQQNKKNALESYHAFERKAVANFKPNQSLFCTLTFDDSKTKDFDIRNVAECNEKFSNFIKRLKRHLKKKIGRDVRYLVTIEFQDKNKRYAIHYHMLLDVPYLDNDELAEIWGLGFTKVNKVKDSKHAAVYCGKYMMKGILDSRLTGKDKYWGSNNLLNPKIRYGNIAQKIKDFIDSLPDDKKEKYSDRSYQSEYNKCNIHYEKFFLPEELTKELITYLDYNTKTS